LTTEVKILSGKVNERRTRNTNKGGAVLVKEGRAPGKAGRIQPKAPTAAM